MGESNKVEETVYETKFRKDSSRIDTKLLHNDKKKADKPSRRMRQVPRQHCSLGGHPNCTGGTINVLRGL